MEFGFSLVKVRKLFIVLHRKPSIVLHRKLSIVLLGVIGAIGLLVAACISQPSSESVGQAQPATGWEALQQNQPGYVVMMRHATAPGTGDPANFKLDDCSTQRNLSAEGREQARQIGEAFRRRNISVIRVLSSQWCRCLDTAALLNLAKVEPFPALNSFFNDFSTEATQTAQVKQFITENRNTNGVIIMVTHQVNITSLTEIVPQSGEAVVLRSNESADIEVVGPLPM